MLRKHHASPTLPSKTVSCPPPLTHELGESLRVFLLDAEVVDRDADGYDADGHAELNGPLDDGKHHQEEADDKEQDGEADPHLDGAGAVRVPVPQPQQRGDGHQDEEWLGEGDVVDEHLHVWRDQHEQCHQALWGDRREGRDHHAVSGQDICFYVTPAKQNHSNFQQQMVQKSDLLISQCLYFIVFFIMWFSWATLWWKERNVVIPNLKIHN